MVQLCQQRASHWCVCSPCTRRDVIYLPQVLSKHRAPDDVLTLVESILRPLQSRYVYMSYEEHDEVTANTQAVTHAAFLSYV
jgi:prephenate dehydrogenase